MNGPISMYNLKPVIQVMNSVDFSSSMYRMKNIHGSYFSCKPGQSQYQENPPNVLQQVKKLLKVPLADVEHLEQHQEAILKQLAILKQQMAAFRIELSQQASIPLTSISRTKSASCSSTSSKPVTWNGLIHDVVVNASPSCPPHSLLAIRKVWSDVLNLQVTCYTHSSVTSPPSHLSHFESPNGPRQTGQSRLNVSLIWKNMGPDCEVIVSPLNQLALRGEVNLIRYLHHTLYPPADAITETKLDNLLDICHRLIHAKTIKEKQSLVREINAAIGKSAWLGGDTMDVADIAVWSALKNTENVELTQNIQKWQDRCKCAIGLC